MRTCTPFVQWSKLSVMNARHLLLALSVMTTIATPADRRIVDRVIIGDVVSEESHGYAGGGVTVGTADGRTYRQARGWMRYALTVFDDTEVTLAASFLASGDTARTFDVIVENHLVASHTYRSAETSTVEFRVPFAITRGRTNLLVVLRATDGSTPRLTELRSVQDHNE